MFGTVCSIMFYSSDSDTRHRPLHLLQPWRVRFLYTEFQIFFWDSVQYNVLFFWLWGMKLFFSGLKESMKIFYYILLSVKREGDFSFYASNVTFCWKFRQERKENDLSAEYLESVALLEIWWFIQFCKTVLDANQDLSQWLFRWISKESKKCDYQNF